MPSLRQTVTEALPVFTSDLYRNTIERDTFCPIPWASWTLPVLFRAMLRELICWPWQAAEQALAREGKPASLCICIILYLPSTTYNRPIRHLLIATRDALTALSCCYRRHRFAKVSANYPHSGGTFSIHFKDRPSEESAHERQVGTFSYSMQMSKSNAQPTSGATA